MKDRQQKSLLVIAVIFIGVSIFMLIQYRSQADLYSQQISLKELEENIQSENGYYVYYFQPNCSHCKKVSPFVVPLGKKQNDRFALVDLSKHKGGWIKLNISQTPTIVYYESGKERKRIEGEHTESQYQNFFEN